MLLWSESGKYQNYGDYLGGSVLEAAVSSIQPIFNFLRIYSFGASQEMRNLSLYNSQPSIAKPHLGSWKQKIGFLDNLSTQIQLRELSLSPQLLNNIWLDLVKETNFNVLQKAVDTLKTWVPAYGVKSIRVQRELVKSLIGLAKMARSQIDQSVSAIIIALYFSETQQTTPTQRVPFDRTEHERFNSSNNPTFFMGYESSDTMSQEDEEKKEPDKNKEIETSFILGMLVESMRTCQKHSFALCVKILIELMQRCPLASPPYLQLLSQVNKINKVIEHRKVPPSEADFREKRLDEEIAALVEQFRQFEE